MNRVSSVTAAAAMALLLPLARTAIAQPPAMAVVSPEVDAGRRITFRLLAPNAKEVSVHGEFARAAIPMTKDEKGVWSASVGPVRPDVYGYGFRMDGLNLPDPCNTFVRVGSLAYESQVYVPGEEADFLAAREVPHGALHEHWYFSKRLNATRRVVVYTPPGYDARGGPYPVLYLLHGMGDDEGFWTSVGRANFVLDNLLAAKKARPALVVMPFGHSSRSISRGPGAARPASSPASGPPSGGMFDVPMLESDLKENIMPLVEREYRAGRDRRMRAIAGLSMGGYQAMAIGLNNLPMFAYVGGFSSALVGPGFETVVQPFLADPEAANRQLKLLWLGCGRDDGLLAANRKFEEALTARGIRHEWTDTPGYAHWWTLWRVYLRDFAQKLFTDN